MSKTADEAMREAAEVMRHSLDIATDEFYSHEPSVLNAREALSAALRTLDAAGWVCVPREATQEMLAAAGKEEDRCAVQNYGGSPSADEYWSAMLAAATRFPGVER